MIIHRTTLGGPKPIKNKADPIGRNDPCPCGSGIKYKRCHGDEAALNQEAADNATRQLAAIRLVRQPQVVGDARVKLQCGCEIVAHIEPGQDYKAVISAAIEAHRTDCTAKQPEIVDGPPAPADHT